MPPALRELLSARRRLLVFAGVLVVGVTILRWGAYADGGSPERSLAMALSNDVVLDEGSVIWWGERGPTRFQSVLFRGQVDEGGTHDLYYVAVRMTDDGEVLGTRGLSNLTRSGSADEDRPVQFGPHHVGYAIRVDDRIDAFAVLDLLGESDEVTADWPARARAQNAITNLQETGRTVGMGRTRYAFVEPMRSVTLAPDGEHLRVSFESEADEGEVIVSVEGVVRGEDYVEVEPQQKGMPGTITWVVDSVRNLSFVGPEPIAWLESRVFAAKDFLQRAYYGVVGQPDTVETVAEELGVTVEESRRRAELSVTDPELGWPPAPMEPLVDEPAEGEGQWIAIVDDPFVRSYPNAPPAFYSSYLLVDPDRPFTRVYLVVWDPRAVQLRIMSGTREPESATGATAPGMVPRTPESLGRVVAGFNGGFQSLHGEFGMMSEGRVYLPPKPWAATVAIRNDGAVQMGSWRGPPEGIRYYSESWANDQIPDDMVELRQNLTSVVEDGRWNPWRRWYWGAAPQGDEEQVFIDRSGLCLTEEGFVVYLWGKSMGAEELGKAMLAARCVRGLHLDMNQRHTAFELYHAFERDDPPPDLPRPIDPDMEFEINVPYARGWRVRGRKLVRTMTPMTFPRYIRRDPRDFFYLTLKPVLPGPHVEGTREGEGVFDTTGLPHAGWPHAFALAWLGHAPPEEADEQPRTHLVRIDPARVFFGERPHSEPESESKSESESESESEPDSESAAEDRPLAYLTNARHTEGSLALYWVAQQIGRRFAVGRELPEGAHVVLRGQPLAEGEVAALGVDPDGFIVYAEAENGDALETRMAAARVDAPLGLGSIRLAFALETMNVGPDTYERELDVSTALPIVANETPQHEILFPNVEPRPYMYWGPMQDVRVRYFRGEGPRRFTGPDSDPDAGTTNE